MLIEFHLTFVIGIILHYSRMVMKTITMFIVVFVAALRGEIQVIVEKIYFK